MNGKKSGRVESRVTKKRQERIKDKAGFGLGAGAAIPGESAVVLLEISQEEKNEQIVNDGVELSGVDRSSGARKSEC